MKSPCRFGSEIFSDLINGKINLWIFLRWKYQSISPQFHLLIQFKIPAFGFQFSISSQDIGSTATSWHQPWSKWSLGLRRKNSKRNLRQQDCLAQVRRLSYIALLRLIFAGSAGIAELAIFHPVQVVTCFRRSRLTLSFRSTQSQNGWWAIRERCAVSPRWSIPYLSHRKITSASRLNTVIFKNYADATVARKFTSLFPGLGYAAGYKVGLRNEIYIHNKRWSVADFPSRYYKEYTSMEGNRLRETILLYITETNSTMSLARGREKPSWTQLPGGEWKRQEYLKAESDCDFEVWSA